MPAHFNRNPHLGAQLANHFGDLIEQGGFVVVRGAKRRAPVDTGTLRNSLHADTERHGTAVHVEIGSNVHYAVYQEFGTAKMRGKHFLAHGVQDAARWLAKNGFQIHYTANNAPGGGA